MKRFYKTVSTAHDDAGWRVLLDGKPIRTPGKAEALVPTAALADALAAEWDAQTETINPKTMPLTRFANTVIDGVAAQRDAVAAEIAQFGESDLICYRAHEPAALAARQQDAWAPLVDWAAQALGAPLIVTQGIMHQSQPPEALAALKAAVSAQGNWQLAPLHAMVSITGSLVIGLALLAGRLTPEQAFAAGHLDELFQAEHWGEDAQAAEIRALRRADLDAAARFAALARHN